MKNKNKMMLLLVGVAILLFFAKDMPIQILFEAGPWWVYFVIAGIILSGYYWIKYTIEDKKMDNEWIEKEGEVYMERIERAREKKGS